MKENIDKLFSYFNCDKVSIYRSLSSSQCNSYYVAIYIGESNGCISGKVKYDITKSKSRTCIEVYEDSSNYHLPEVLKKELLELSYTISVNTSAIDGYSLEIHKNKKDYILKIPEMNMRSCLANVYWGD